MVLRFLLIVLCFLFLAPTSRALASLPEAPLPAELSPALDHLLAQVGPGRGGDFDPARIERLLDFVLAPPGGALLYEAKDRKKITSAFYSFTLKSDLARLLRYAYHPAIPPQVITPSSVRLGHWTEVDGKPQPLPRLWERLPGLTRPVVVRGAEIEEITPNLATGTYFAYDLHRTLILFPWRGKPVLLNISRQKDRSAVGMKGAVVGPDHDWNYLYSGEKGVAQAGLGWVDSYMYDSYSIGVFCETGDGVRAGMFKWLNAGWKGLNMVRREHIHEGLVRYARDLKEVLESPRLPSADDLAAGISRLVHSGQPEVKGHLQRALDRLAERHGNDRAIARAGLRGMLRGGAYLERLTRPQLEAALALELMKAFLGRPGADPQLLSALRH